MSRDATLGLLAAVKAALLADATIAAAVADRVHANWGTKLDAPCIRLSVPSVRLFESDCGDGSEYTLRAHVFATDRLVTGQLAAQVREVLQDRDLDLAGADLWWLTYDLTITQQDPDNPTLTMAVVTFQAVTTST